MRLIWVAASIVGLMLAGCSGGSAPESGESAPVAQAPAANAKLQGTLEVVAFKGGYGIDFYEKAAQEFGAKHPDLKVTVSGDPRVWEQLRPRLLSDDVPSLMLPGWGMDHWTLAEEGQLMTLDAALDSPSADGKTKWRDTFEPAILKMGQRDGKQYILPFYFNIWGWWIDPGVFAKHGWTAPKTTAELLALCDKIKAAGLAPITFQGKYPYYMLNGMILPWVQSAGGMKALSACQNLEPGAWKAAPVLQAAKLIADLRDKGFFETGAVGMSHTESQTEFVTGKAAMIPCGTWLESEMKKVMPPGAKLEFIPVPNMDGGSGEPTAINIDIEPWMIPAKAKNSAAAIEFFKYMTSPEKAKEFVETKATLTAIRGSDTTQIPATLQKPLEAFRSSKATWSYLARQWYPKMETEIENAITALLNKQATPEQFCDRCEAAAEAMRKDDTVKKHRYE